MSVFTSPTGVKYQINDRQDIIYEVLQQYGYFETELIQLSIEHLTRFPGVIVDVGANIGTYCLELAIRFPECQIYAFDPVLPTYEELQANIALNGFTNIETHRVGLGDVECELEAEDPDRSGSYGSLTLLTEIDRIRGGIGFLDTAVYQVRTLDSFNLDNVSLIKIDVEGMELKVIKGSLETISRCSPMLIFEAWNLDWYAEQRIKLIQFVEDLGYTLTPVADDFVAVK
jgi:FkbM family methyltransferase